MNGSIASSSPLKCADTDGAAQGAVRCDEFVREAELNPWLDVSYLTKKRKRAMAIIKELRCQDNLIKHHTSSGRQRC